MIIEITEKCRDGALVRIDRIKTDEQPRWSEPNQRFYAGGYRWIKTRQKWSGTRLIHSFNSYTVVEA